MPRGPGAPVTRVFSLCVVQAGSACRRDAAGLLHRRYARRVGITSSLKELRHYSATQLLAAGTDLNTVAGRLGHAEGSTTLKFYAQFTRPADQRAAAVIPSQLDGLRKKERLRELYGQHQPASASDSLAALASVIGPQAGLDEDIALAWLTEFAAAD